MFQNVQECLLIPNGFVYRTLQKNQSAFPRMHAEPAAPDAALVLTQVADKKLLARTLNMISEVTAPSIHTTALAHDISMRTLQNSVQRLHLNHLPQIDLCTI